MRTRSMTGLAGLTIVAALALAGCAGSDSDTAKDTAPTTGTTCDYPTDGSSPAKQVDPPPAAATTTGEVGVTITTSAGDIKADLDANAAPCTVNSFVSLAKQGYFDGTSCHRLTTSGIAVLQCGDPTGTGTGGPGFEYGPVENAPKDNVYKAGTVAMARQSGNGKSMGSQFFLVYKDSTIPSDAAGGYTVLGDITKGMDVVQKVAAGGVTGGASDGAPTRAVSIASTAVSAG
jgi:peptidyl-prolyl cis-trans isomerase B (cyclophilin B)